MDISELKELIELFENSSVAEMDFERGECRICLRRESSGRIAVVQDAGTAQSGGLGPAVMAAGGSVPEIAVTEPVSDAEPGPELVIIEAPMVGVFYAASSPDTDPFVTVGQSIEEGQTVAIISAMKVMNEIKSEIAGTVREIRVENGQPVEYNQPLFAVEEALPDDQQTLI